MVSNLQPTAFTTTTVNLAWDTDVTPSGFRLTVVPATASSPLLVPASSRSAVVTGLLPGTVYTFSLAAYVNVSGALVYGVSESASQQTGENPI